MIYVGDCLDILPTIAAESVNLIVTSPPYPKQRGCKLSVPEWCEWMGQVLAEAHRILTSDGVIALNVKFRRDNGWFDTRLFTAVPTVFQKASLHMIDVYIWHKANPVPAGNLNRTDIPAWEPVFVAAKSLQYAFYPVREPYAEKTLGKLKNGNKTRSVGINGNYSGGHGRQHPEGARQGNVLHISPSADANRPRAKGQSFPVALAERFILQHTRPGEVVLDMFCGVGTTGYSALELGRSFIGIEVDEGEARKAQEWIRN